MEYSLRAALTAAVFTFATSTQASTFYDWDPDPGNGGVGFLEVGPVADAANFISEPLVDFSFQFSPTGGSVALSDVDTITDPSAVAVVIANLLAIDSMSFSPASTLLSFNEEAAGCLGPDSPVGFCTGVPEQSVILSGQWTLRQAQPPAVPEPTALALFAFGLAALGFHRKNRKYRRSRSTHLT